MSGPPSGKSPAPVGSVISVPTRAILVKPHIDTKVTRDDFVAALRTARQSAAADVIEESTFSLCEAAIHIQTNISKTMLPVVFNPDTLPVMEAALVQRGHTSVKFRLLPALPPKDSPLKKLAQTAEKLNKVSDQLTVQIELIEREFKRLNLGVTAWVTISQDEDEDGNWTREELGYTRIGNRWGVALKTLSGMLGDESEPDETFSGFSDAPRQLRIRAVKYIPELIEQLSVEAEAMIAKLSPEVDEVSQLTQALLAIPEVKK
jgi:hypothetical protein